LSDGTAPIPWPIIDAFARRYRIRSLDEFELFVWQIRTIEKLRREAAPKED
jgi:hypothetical protein